MSEPGTKRIHRFKDEYEFLSNFSPAVVYHDGIEYHTVEHAFQAAKTLDFAKRWLISKLASPVSAKCEGRKALLRPDWESAKYLIMIELVLQKFSRYPELREQLLATGDAELVEGNYWHDNYWGDCVCSKCSTPGRNALGLILMSVRSTLR